MSYAIGELREFATGDLYCAEAWPPYGPGGGIIRMVSEQRVWNGAKWASIHEAPTPELTKYYNEQRKI